MAIVKGMNVRVVMDSVKRGLYSVGMTGVVERVNGVNALVDFNGNKVWIPVNKLEEKGEDCMFKIDERVVAVNDSTRGFYSEGMEGVVNDIRANGSEVLVKFDNRIRRVWCKVGNLNRLTDIEVGDTVIAINDSPKGFYTTGMIGVADDYRNDDGGEFLVRFNDRERRAWCNSGNLAKAVSYADDCDDDCTDVKSAILIKDQEDYKAGTVFKIVGDGFGYYIVDRDGDRFNVEKQDLFIIPEDEVFYIHILDLRKLRKLGCHFGKDSGLLYGDKKFIAPNMTHTIDKSFVASVNDTKGIIEFTYKGKTYTIQSWELDAGLIELRD